MTALHPAGAPQLHSMFNTVSYAAHPVWKDSARGPVKFVPLAANRKDAKAMAVKLFHHARRFERMTRESGGKGFARRQNGRLSRVGIAVFHAMIFDFMDYKSGRLDPCYESIAEKAGVSLSSVYRALKRLKAAGLINWVRRCSETTVDGRYVLEQESNAYGITPASQWKGYGFTEAPRPHPSTWGATPPLKALGIELGDSADRIIACLEGNPSDPLAVILAKWGRLRSRRAGSR